MWKSAAGPQTASDRYVSRAGAVGKGPGRCFLVLCEDRPGEPGMLVRLVRNGLAAALLLTGIHAAAAQDAFKVAVGQRGGWEQCVSELGLNAGLFKPYGLI